MQFTPRNLGVFVCRHVFENTRPILYVSHDGDGDWVFMCGGTDHDVESADDFLIVGIGHLLDRDPSVNACADLAKGFEAERNSPADRWIRRSV